MAASARQLIFEKLKAISMRRTSLGVEGRTCDRGPSMVAPDAAAGGKVALQPAARQAAPGLGLRTTGAYLVRAATRRARRTVVEQQWQLLVGEQRPHLLAPDPSCLQRLVPEPGRYWADPFAVVYEGQTHVFFEEFVYDSRRGRIAVVTLDAQGRPGGKAVALELDTHLSYPCVFIYDGRLFMVPESAYTSTVDLY